ncbi:MAG: pyruvate kinase [Deltaproteobacteria bacterium]|nr:pyruvate kinase [Deltaproteobacteria bacterium]
MKSFNQTKIVATLGPASGTVEIIRQLIQAGADGFRLNFSHGDGPALAPLIEAVRQAEKTAKAHIPILADIQGPKLRIGQMPKDGVTLLEGERITLTERPVEGSVHEVHSPYEFLTRDVKAGSRILLADGSIELMAERIEGPDVICRIMTGGRLYSNKGLNLPGTRLSVETLTAKDERDLAYVGRNGLDMVAISFVRSAADIHRAREFLGNSKIPVMAKLERPEALDHLDEILEASDGVMVARGDLGVELDFERVPILQKRILSRAAVRGKWAIVATQMLGSMVLNHRPSRAEVSDVANAVLDGADAVMLSEETAAGNHPVESVEAMARISREAETVTHTASVSFEADIMSFAAGAAGAAVSAAERLNARAIVALAGSGLTALLVSKWKPRLPILAMSAHVPTLRRMNVLRGVIPVAIGERAGMERQLEAADRFLVQDGWAAPGDTVVVVAAIPLGEGKETNTIRFHKVRGGK